MYEVILDALIDTVKMVPLLLVIYIGIELIEYKKTKSRERKTIKVKRKTCNICYLLYTNITFLFIISQIYSTSSSPISGLFGTYNPYLSTISAKLKDCLPYNFTQ